MGYRLRRQRVNAPTFVSRDAEFLRSGAREPRLLCLPPATCPSSVGGVATVMTRPTTNYLERNAATRASSRGRLAGAVWHSQTVSTCQPARRNAWAVRLSRAAFRLSFASQYRRREVGIRHRPQLCMCQKQPLTLMIFRRRGNTRSGVPGSERTWSR